MSITLTITSETASDFMAKFSQVASHFQPGVKIEVPQIQTPKTETPAAAKEAKETKAKSGKTKAESATVSASDVPADTSASVASTPAEASTSTSGLTKDDVSAAVQRISAAKDLETARAVINKFKKADGTPATRISEIQEKDYEDFVNTANATIEG